MSNAVTPLVIAEGLDVVIHDSVDEAERSLEAQDVRDGVDATGRRLVLRPVSRPPSGRGPEVEIELASDGETHEDELRELLLDYLSSRTVGKVDVSAGDVRYAPMPQLIAAVRVATGSSRRGRSP